ncbi:nitrogen fixation protein NifR [Staphylococcus aureus]|nr:nitrogen fixation protein NifR [Staphylococcus aureus]
MEPRHREISSSISTDNASWRAPTQKLAKSQLTIVCKLGWDDEINFAKISFLSHSQKDSSRIISFGISYCCFL